VKMRRCEDEKMRRCEDEKMFYRRPLLEEPCAQTLSGKTAIKFISAILPSFFALLRKNPLWRRDLLEVLPRRVVRSSRIWFEGVVLADC